MHRPFAGVWSKTPSERGAGIARRTRDTARAADESWRRGSNSICACRTRPPGRASRAKMCARAVGGRGGSRPPRAPPGAALTVCGGTCTEIRGGVKTNCSTCATWVREALYRIDAVIRYIDALAYGGARNGDPRRPQRRQPPRLRTEEAHHRRDRPLVVGVVRFAVSRAVSARTSRACRGRRRGRGRTAHALARCGGRRLLLPVCRSGSPSPRARKAYSITMVQQPPRGPALSTPR